MYRRIDCEANSVLMQPLGTGIKILVMFVTLAVYEDVVLDNQHTLWTLQLGILRMPEGS